MKCDKQQEEAQGGQKTFQSTEKHATEPPATVCCVVILVSIMSSKCPGVPGVPPDNISSTTGSSPTSG